MKNLSVYYCPQCGHYGYHHRSAGHAAVCPLCDMHMSLLDIACKDFMVLSQESRDVLIIRDILSKNPLSTNLIESSSPLFGQRCLSAVLISQIQQLSEENMKLHETVEWMHRTIWELLGKYKNENG